MTSLKNLLLTGIGVASLAFSGCGNKEEITGKVIEIIPFREVIPSKKSFKLMYEIQSGDKKIFANLIPNSPIWEGDSIQILNYSIIDENGINYWKQDFNQGELKNAMYINIEKYKLPNKKSTREIIDEGLGRSSKK